MVYSMLLGKSLSRRKPISNSLKNMVKKAQGYRCYRCNKVFSPSMLAVHHKSGNPANPSPANLIALCHNCHSQMHIYGTRTVRDELGFEHKKRVLIAKPLRKGRPRKRVRRKKKKIQRDIFGNKISGNLFSGYRIS